MFTDNVADGRGSKMNPELYRSILSTHIQSNTTKWIQCSFTRQMDDDPKHTEKTTRDFFKAKKLNIFQWSSQPADLNPTERALQLLKTKLKTERPIKKQQLELP